MSSATNPTTPVDPGARDANEGEVHADLMGGGLRYRPERLDTTRLNESVVFSGLVEGVRVGPLRVLDVSTLGIGMQPTAETMLTPGATISDAKISYRGTAIWTGQATVVHHVASDARIGARFVGSLFPLQRLRVHDSQVEQDIDIDLDGLDRSRLLTTEWRAAVAELRRLMLIAESAFRRVEAETTMAVDLDTAARHLDHRAFIEMVYAKWAPRYMEQLSTLHTLSASFSTEVREIARQYAMREVLPQLMDCPAHRRAYQKPRGYAGDYRLMELFFKDVLEAETPTLYGRFLHHVAKGYALGQAVVGREQFMRSYLTHAVEGGAERIASLACGPALEMRNMVPELSSLSRPLSLVLIDQDDVALRSAHDGLSQQVVARPMSLDVSALHLSVRQLLRPKRNEIELIQQNLTDVDVVYAMGLYDYLPQRLAKLLTKRLYQCVRPGGRVVIGNLREAPNSTWLMDYVVAWQLQYRTLESMRDLADGITPQPADVKVHFDRTELCMFLEVQKPRG